MDFEFPNANNRLAFFGFEGTLISHTPLPRLNGYFAECVHHLTVRERPGAALPCMQWYVRQLFLERYGLYCLSVETSNLRDRRNKEELDTLYPDTPMTYLSADKPEHKVDLIRAVALAEACDPGDVLFVDTDMAAVGLALAAGINAKHLSEIVILYETKDCHQEQARYLNPAGMDVGISDADLEQAYQECCSLVEQAGILA